MDTKNLQQQLLDAVQSKFPRKQDAIQALSELLSVSADGIYRRLRGDTVLSPEEIVILATRFQLSLDKMLFGQSEALLFSYNMLSNPITHFGHYVEEIHQNLLDISNIKGLQVYYASQEIPIFQYFCFPHLLSFKLYVYGLTTWEFDFLKGQKYHPRLIDPEVLRLGTECVRLYSHLPTKDLWSLNIIDNTLNQIEYMSHVELFEDPNDALLVCDEIIQFIEKAKKMAVKGNKSMTIGSANPGSGVFDLYYNEMISTNNTILVCTPMGSMLFATVNNPNFLKSTDQEFCRIIEYWFERIINRSTAISVHSAKSRDWYFNRLKRKVLATREKITSL